MGLFLISRLLILFAHSATLPIDLKIQEAALTWGLDPKLVQAIISVESAYTTRAISPKGAMGLMQVMPKTADSVEIHQPMHALSNLMGACQYLRQMLNRFRGNTKLALAAYNAGPHNVIRYKGIPPFPETQKYVKKIMSLYRRGK